MKTLSDRGYYTAIEDDGSEICAVCHPFCKKCHGPMDNECDECEPGFILQGTTCSDTCNSGEYLDVDSI